MKTLLTIGIVLMLAVSASGQCLPGQPCYSQGVPQMTRTYQPPTGMVPAQRSGGMAQVYVPIPDPPPVVSDDKVRRPLKDDVQRQQDQIRQLQSGKADAGQTIPVQLPIPGPGSDELDAVMSSIDATNQTLIDVSARLDALETWLPLLDRLAKAEQKLLAIDPDKLRTELGREVQADSKAALAKAEEAKQAAEKTTTAVEKVADAIPAAAETAATKAVEAATPGLLDRLKGLLPEGVAARVEAVSTKLSALHKWVWGSYAGLIGLGIAVIWIFKDVRDYIKTGGQDKLTVQVIADKLDKLAERTRNPYDDYATGGMQAVANQLAAIIEKLSGMEKAPAKQPAAAKQ